MKNLKLPCVPYFMLAQVINDRDDQVNKDDGIHK